MRGGVSRVPRHRKVPRSFAVASIRILKWPKSLRVAAGSLWADANTRSRCVGNCIIKQHLQSPGFNPPPPIAEQGQRQHDIKW